MFHISLHSFREFAYSMIQVANNLIPLIIGLAFVYFLYGVMLYVGTAGSEAKKTVGKEVIISGIIGLAVMIAMWGIVLAVRTFFFGSVI